MRLSDDLHLAYCTNIHGGRGWEDVLANLERYVVPLKERLSPGAPFGVGLRLSGEESRELLVGDRLTRFRRFLDERGLYVFTMNGFPYGPFHGASVKENVHAPDWRDPERLAYTLRLVEILAALLPEGAEGSISTSPLSYKHWIDTRDAGTWDAFLENLLRVAEALLRVREEQGRYLHLDIEPEPDGLLESCSELQGFFEERLLPCGAPRLARRAGITEDEARARLLEHVQVCFDTCHAAVAFEEPAEVLERFDATGIRVGKIQVSSALEVDLRDADRKALEWKLRRFDEPTYLHQVVQRNRDGTLTRYPDLPVALERLHDPDAISWRVHFHVPIFLERYGELTSTQEAISRTFRELRRRPFTRHLEIETYTWNVLPGDMKLDLLASIEREYRWVLDDL